MNVIDTQAQNITLTPLVKTVATGIDFSGHVTVGGAGNLYVSKSNYNVVRKVGTNGIIAPSSARHFAPAVGQEK